MGAHHPLPLGMEIQAVRMQEGCFLGEGLYFPSIHTPKSGGKADEPRTS